MRMRQGSLLSSALVAVAGLLAAPMANAAWTFGSGNTVGADASAGNISITNVTGWYAANGGTLPSGAMNTSIVAAGGSCADSQCGVGSQNTYGINGFAAAGTAWASSSLQYYSGGKGMSSDSSSGATPNHAIDNGPGTSGVDPNDFINGIGNTESVMLSFSGSVVLSGINIGWKFGDADVSVFRFTGTVAPSLTGVGASLSSMQTAGWELVGNYGDLSESSPDNNPLSGSTKGSSWWLISAYNSSYGAAKTGTVDQGNDYFKLFAVSGSKCLTGNDCGGPQGSSSVPEPASLALVAVALAGTVGASRRKTAAKT